MIPIRYSKLSKSAKPSLKIKIIPENPIITPMIPLKVNFCKPKKMLKIKISKGEVALIKEAKLLVKFFSATVVNPLAMINIKKEITI